MSQKVSKSVCDLFGLKNVAKQFKVEINSKPCAFTPKVNPDYVFRQDLVSDILAWMILSEKSGDGLLLTGPTGSGKTSVVTQIMARMNIPMQTVSGHSRLEMADLVGHMTIMDGDTIWQDGPLTTAMRYGHVFCLDEFDLLDPGVTAGLNGVVEGASLVLAENGGEIVERHPDFKFIVTGNTNGGGDANGLYQGTMQQNTALMDRMWVIKVGYADEEQELSLLSSKIPKMPEPIMKQMIAVANDIRELFMGKDDEDQSGSIEVTMSTRTLVRWATLSDFFKSKRAQGIDPFEYALERALTNRASPVTKVALKEVLKRHFPDNPKA